MQEKRVKGKVWVCSQEGEYAIPSMEFIRRLLVNESVFRPLERMPESTAALRLTQTEFLMMFTASCCEDSSY